MTSRRDFIRVSGLGMGGLAMGASSYGIYNSLAKSPPNGAGLTIDTSRTPTYCEICFWKCAGWYHSRKERAN